MSGRAALLATSPEQAHAAAHATAMAAMAAGFSPHASLAAAFGLPEGITPYGSHPLLQVIVCTRPFLTVEAYSAGGATDLTVFPVSDAIFMCRCRCTRMHSQQQRHSSSKRSSRVRTAAALAPTWPLAPARCCPAVAWASTPPHSSQGEIFDPRCLAPAPPSIS